MGHASVVAGVVGGREAQGVYAALRCASCYAWCLSQLACRETTTGGWEAPEPLWELFMHSAPPCRYPDYIVTVTRGTLIAVNMTNGCERNPGRAAFAYTHGAGPVPYDQWSPST